MSSSADALRRWFGLLFLALAFGMLIWGQTVLRPQLERRPKLFVLYWCGCFLLTGAAIAIALLDMRATRKRARREHEDLVQRTLAEIDKDSDKKHDE
jgi:hypothetical protein